MHAAVYIQPHKLLPCFVAQAALEIATAAAAAALEVAAAPEAALEAATALEAAAAVGGLLKPNFYYQRL